MKNILFKDLKIFVLFTMILMIPSFILWNTYKSDAVFPVAVFVQLAIVYVITFLTVLINEQEEDVNNGYRFFQTLPIRKGNITLIKFTIPVIVLLVLALINRGIYSIFPVGKDIIRRIDSLTFIFSIFFLLNAGIILVLIYLFGYTKFIQINSGFIVLIVFGSFIISKLFRFEQADLGNIANSIEKWLLHGNHSIFILSGLIIYTCMGFAANMIEKN